MAKLEIFYRKHFYIQQLDSTINIFPYLLYHISFQLSSSLSIHQFTGLIFEAFQSKLQTLVHLPLARFFPVHSLARNASRGHLAAMKAGR